MDAYSNPGTIQFVIRETESRNTSDGKPTPKLFYYFPHFPRQHLNLETLNRFPYFVIESFATWRPAIPEQRQPTWAKQSPKDLGVRVKVNILKSSLVPNLDGSKD